MKHFTAIFWCFLLFVPLLPGQVVKTNEKGEKIIEYPDGSWKPYTSEEAIPSDEPDPEEEARSRAIRYAELLSADAAQLESFAQDARTRRLEMKEEWEYMSTHPGEYAEKEIQNLEQKLKETRAQEDLAFSLYDQAARLAQDAENLIFLKPKKRDKAMKKLEAEKTSFEARRQLLSDSGADPSNKPVQTAQEKTYATYDPRKDTNLNPPSSPCVFTHNEVDRFTGKLRRDVKPVLLFTHTPKDLRPFLQGREYITCWGHLADLSDGLLFLSLEFVITSNNAPVAFGGIPNGSILSIKTIDGDPVRLINTKNDRGHYDSLNEVYVYRSQYQISGAQERFLESAELDQFRVIWSTGYEDYEVFELDFFRDQINCLRNNN